MSRRFSDEPIKLIHRIPSPEQLSAARPTKRSFGEAVIHTGTACFRTVVAIVTPLRFWTQSSLMTENPTGTSNDVGPEGMEGQTDGGVRTLASGRSRSDSRFTECLVTPAQTTQSVQPAASPESEHTADIPPEISGHRPSVQYEDIVELRTYILRQQEDIARLSRQLQELKSLVVSQQQILAYLGKELESNHSQISTANAMAQAPAKRNRVAREKPMMKEKEIPCKGVQTSSPYLLLGLASLMF